MTYAFNRETVRYELGRQAIGVPEDAQGPDSEFGLDQALASYPDPAIEVWVEGKKLHGRFGKNDRTVILDTGLSPGQTGRISVYAEVVVREASRLQGLRRADLGQEALDWLKAQGHEIGEERRESADQIPEDVLQTFMVAFFERSACLAAAESMRGMPEEWKSVEGFASLMPDKLVVDWVKATFRLNPHWPLAEQPEGDEEKKGG